MWNSIPFPDNLEIFIILLVGIKQTKIMYFFNFFQSEEHIDKAIRIHIDCNYQSFHRIGKVLPSCGLIPEEAGSNDLSRYQQLGAAHREPQLPE